MAIPQIKRLSDDALAKFVSLKCIDPQTFQPVIEPISRPNVDGYAFRKLAKKGKPWRVIAMRDFPSMADAEAAVQYLRDGLIGELCDITTRANTTYGRMMCLEVTQLDVREVMNASGGLSAADPGIFTFTPLGGSPPATQKYGLATVELVFVHASAPGDEP